MPKHFSKLLLSIGISFSAALIGTIFNIPSIPTWYNFLNKPIFNPPNWIFGPVWTVLYFLIGISLYLLWEKGLDKKEVKFAFRFFLIHLTVNSLWSIVFFGLKEIFFGLIIISTLLTMIIYLIKLLLKIDKRAAYLLVPYLAWVSFATILNYSIWQLNK